MNTAFDDFLAGRGPLAGLIQAQPDFEPPEALFEQVMDALTPDTDAWTFEPPASLAASVLAEAARLDEAQAPRRDAVLAQIAAGASPAEALGTAVPPEAADWLSARAERLAPTPTVSPRRARRRRWFQGFGVAVAAALAASVALKVAFDPAAPTVDRLAAVDREEAAAELARPPAPAPALAEKRARQRTESDTSAPPQPRPQATPAPARPSERMVSPRRVAPATAPLVRGDMAAAFTAPAGTMASTPLAEAPPMDAPPPLADSVADAAPAPLAQRKSSAGARLKDVEPLALPLDTPAQAIARQLLAQQPGQWVWMVDAADTQQARQLMARVAEVLTAEGRTDALVLRAEAGPPGRLRISPAAPRSPASLPPPRSAGGE